MRQVNFVVIFVITLALVLFSLENTEPATIHVLGSTELTAPLAVELIVAMGIGAVFAWIFSVWASVQKMIALKSEQEQVEAQQVRIQELEEDLTRYKTELEVQQKLLPSAPIATAEET
ncbi:lipopolysaccharide assembly protein LapA domain-containing protein [Synechococcus elongatus]|uniref:LapA family protein n=1 Tax=Synechococcus elongatus PCC 11801 TaxID=2219813 RepID=A0AAN1QNJ2_SYNEL|nr:LapA family protein [Synechococcus elongatus]AZB72572.1 DUF1049 domain-containing protein [Synechococcus elongatus PCC 11801]